MPPNQPCNLEVEEALLGAALIDPDEVITRLASQVQPEDFYWHPHGWAWAAMLDLAKRGAAVDFVTLCDELERHGKLAEYAAYDGSAKQTAGLMRLISAVPTSLNAETYAATVRDYAAKRKILDLMGKGAKWALNGTGAVDILGKLEHEISGISVYSGATLHTVTSAADAVKRTTDLIERAQGGDIPAVETGLIDLDKLLNGGMYPDDLLLIAGRPGAGKTAFLVTVMANVAIRRRKRVAVFSMEMPVEQLMIRLLSQMSGVPSERLRSGKLVDDDWTPYTSAIDCIAAAQIYFDDTPALTVNDIRQRLRKLEGDGFDLVLVDQINMMRAGPGAEKRFEQIDQLAYGLKAIAREFRVPVLAAHQLNRGAEDRPHDTEPQLRDLEQAGEKPADVVMFIVHEMAGEMIKSSKIKVVKQRNGRVGSAPVRYFADITRFENATLGGIP